MAKARIIKPDEKAEVQKALKNSIEQICADLLDVYDSKELDFEKEKVFLEKFCNFVKSEIELSELSQNYDVIFLHDDTTMVKSDTDKLYEAFQKRGECAKQLLLILHSRGGVPGAAYLIGKLCREFCNGKFVVVVPRKAKSAATLLATAADEIHMGSLSELGPIDLQIDGVPALGLKNSIEHIASLASQNQGSSTMFADYLSKTVPPIQIGEYERSVESVMQYAERLLETHQKNLKNKPITIASTLVHEYKDHSFVIDKTEAEKIFGKLTVKSNTKEYDFGNKMYTYFSRIERYASLCGYSFIYVGSQNTKPIFMKKK